MRPLCIDLFCGLGGWTEGFLAEGWDVIGFDIEQHVYGEHRYPAQLVLQDVLTLHGRQLKDARCIVASSPCQAYSYMAMPWKRAKQIARALRGQDVFPDGYEGYRSIEALNSLFEAPKRIQREAIEAAGRFIPLVQENVRGAVPWVGRSTWNYGSYHLWGDVPALMPFTHRAQKANPDGTDHGTGSWFAVADSKDRGSSGQKNPGFRFDGSGKSFQSESVSRHTKNSGGSWFAIGSPGQKVTGQNPVTRFDSDALDGVGIGSKSWAQGKDQRHPNDPRNFYSKSPGRKAASAAIAKIPFPLASHIARVYKPQECAA